MRGGYQLAMETFYRRPLPDGLVSFSSPEGRRLFHEALVEGGMDGWFPLAENFHTQAEPAYCALGSLVVVLNALAIDPGRTWKGPWRWYSEDLLDCCDPLEVVKQRGMTLGQVACLARCNGATALVRRAGEVDVDALRADLAAAGRGGPMVLSSFGRGALGQTGDGHFSPIGGWHAGRDLALVLDVARFKYPPFWVPVERLHAAMATTDPATGRSRGWIVLDRDGTSEGREWRIRREQPGWRTRVAELVGAVERVVGEVEPATALGLVDALHQDLPEAMLEPLSPREGTPALVSDRVTLLALAIPDEVLGARSDLVRDLERTRGELPELAQSEIERLRAQLTALLPG